MKAKTGVTGPGFVALLPVICLDAVVDLLSLDAAFDFVFEFVLPEEQPPMTQATSAVARRERKDFGMIMNIHLLAVVPIW